MFSQQKACRQTNQILLVVDPEKLDRVESPFCPQMSYICHRAWGMMYDCLNNPPDPGKGCIWA